MKTAHRHNFDGVPFFLYQTKYKALFLLRIGFYAVGGTDVFPSVDLAALNCTENAGLFHSLKPGEQFNLKPSPVGEGAEERGG